jgi:hypothetical protein
VASGRNGRTTVLVSRSRIPLLGTYSCRGGASQELIGIFHESFTPAERASVLQSGDKTGTPRILKPQRIQGAAPPFAIPLPLW